MWAAHVRANHRAHGGNAAAYGIGPAAVAAIDAVGAGVPAGAAEPGGISAHTTAAAQNRESVANGGLNGSAKPWCSTRASGRAAGPSFGGGASGVDAAGGGAADHGPLGINRQFSP